MSSTGLWSDVCVFQNDEQHQSSSDSDEFALTIDENTIPKSPVLYSDDGDAKLLQLLTHSQNHERCLE